jgi:hypothetical protein
VVQTFNLPPLNKPATNRELAELQARVGRGVGFTDIAVVPQIREVKDISTINLLYQRFPRLP